MKKILSILIMIIVCFSVSGCFIEDLFNKEEEIEQLEGDEILGYFNDIIKNILEINLNSSFTVTTKSSNGPNWENLEVTYSTFDSETGEYEGESGTFVSNDYDYYLTGGKDNSIAKYDKDYMIKLANTDFLNYFSYFKKYICLDAAEIDLILAQEEIDELYKLENEGKIVDSVDINMSYKTLEDDTYAITYTSKSNSYSGIVTYTNSLEISYTFSKDKIYEISYLRDNGEQREGYDYLSYRDYYVIKKTFDYEFNKEYLGTVNGNGLKSQNKVVIYLDCEKVYDRSVPFGTDIDQILSGIEELQTADIVEMYYDDEYSPYKGEANGEPINTSKSYVAGMKTKSTKDTVIYAFTRPTSNKAKVVVTQYTRWPSDMNNHEYKIYRFGYKSAFYYEEVDVGTYSIYLRNGPSDSLVFDDLIKVNGEVINGSEFEITDTNKIYYVDCYLTTRSGELVEVEFYYKNHLMGIVPYQYNSELLYNKAPSYNKYRMYADEEMTIPFSPNTRAVPGLKVYLDFDLEDVFAEILVFDYRKSNDKNPEKVLTMDRININDLHLNYSIDDILLNQSNLDKTRITINGVDFSEQTQFYVEFKQTEHGYKSVLHYRNLEPNTVYVVEIDYFYEGGK